MRFKIALMIPVAAVLGIVAIGAGRNYMERQVNERVRAAGASSQVAAPEVAFGTIVVASAPLRFGMELNLQAVKEIPWPQGQMPRGAFAKVADVVDGKTKRFVIAAMEDNEPLLAAKITGPGQRANLAAVIEEGMKAVTVRVDDVVGVAGFVLPGDRVDVMLTRQRDKGDAFSDIILQNLKVLAIDQLNDERTTKPTISRTVTLEVKTTQAQRLIVAQNVGSLALVLRPAGLASTEPNQRVTSSQLAGDDAPRAPAAEEDGPVASVRHTATTVGVIRKLARQEYSVPATQKQ